MGKNVVEEAIARYFTREIAPLMKRITALEGKTEKVSARDLELAVESTFTKMLGGGRAPAKTKAAARKPAASSAVAVDGDCGHKNNMKSCANCRAKKATVAA